MSALKRVKVAFIIFNVLFLGLGLTAIGYVAWNLSQLPNSSVFLSGKFIFSYSLLGIGFVICLIGLIGCIGGLSSSTCCLKAFIAMTTILLFVDIGVVIAGYMEQSQLQCCAFSNTIAEYSGTPPPSCYKDAKNTSSIYVSLCKESMKDWVKGKIPIWASVIAVAAFVQILSSILSCVLLTKIQSSMRVSQAPAESNPSRPRPRQSKHNGLNF
ncbi:hypothetical protein ACJMK2_042405 [Sinanodonta woodiana]|uniref:Tetraspanin n=1 Tax=Sinanodonta woodiana TaxID=1069815 RepID=A0ABD3WAC9_SINWO